MSSAKLGVRFLGGKMNDQGSPQGSHEYERSMTGRWYFLSVLASLILAALLTWFATRLPPPAWPPPALFAFFFIVLSTSILIFHLWEQSESIISLPGRLRDRILRNEFKYLGTLSPEEARETLIYSRTFLLLCILMAAIGWLVPSWFFIPLVMLGVFATELATIEFRRDVAILARGKVPLMFIYNTAVLGLFVVISAVLQDHGVVFSDQRKEVGVFALNVLGAFAAGSIGAYLVIMVKWLTRRFEI